MSKWTNTELRPFQRVVQLFELMMLPGLNITVLLCIGSGVSAVQEDGGTNL